VAPGPRHRIRWAECDLYGHVNHAAYLVLFEDLRVEHWLSLGQGFGSEAPGPVVARLEVRYLRALGFGDEVLLTLRTTGFRNTSYTHEYALWKGGLCFEAKALLVCVKKRRQHPPSPTQPAPPWPEPSRRPEVGATFPSRPGRRRGLTAATQRTPPG
jgi:acyl-CoA thioester hydrolase